MKVKSKRQHSDIDQRFQDSREYVDEQLELLRQEMHAGSSPNDERLHKIELQLAWLGGFLKGAGLTEGLPEIGRAPD